MVSFVDFAPHFFEVAGILGFGHDALSRQKLGNIFKSKSGQVDPKREYVVIGKERHDFSRPNNQGYPIRGIVGKGYIYLYNYKIGLWPAGNPELGYLDVDGGATKTNPGTFRSGKDRSYWDLVFREA